MTVDHDITLTKSRLTKKTIFMYRRHGDSDTGRGCGTRVYGCNPTLCKSPQPPMISNLGPTKFFKAFGNFNELSTSTSTFI